MALMLDQMTENLRGIALAKAKRVGDLWKIRDSTNNEMVNGLHQTNGDHIATPG